MVKRSRAIHQSGSGSGGGGGGSPTSVVSVALVLCALCVCLCAGATVTLHGDRSLLLQQNAAAAGRYATDESFVGATAVGSAARSGRSAANLSHITGTARKIKMFVKNRYLQLFSDGTVNSTAEDTSDYVILQRTSVNIGQLKIQGVATCMYLCMDACGLLYGSKDFEDECVFNEMIEQHHYNTYSSARYTNDRRTLYLALNKRGVPRKVQVKANAPLGKLSTYARVLTQPVPAQRVEELLAARQATSPQHGHRHHHVCPPHVGPAKRRKSGRKCPGKNPRGKKKTAGGDTDDGKNAKEDEDCSGGGGNKKNGCGGGGGDEVSHRKSDAAGRKRKSKKTAGGGGGKAKAKKPVDSAESEQPAAAAAASAVVQTVTTVVAPSQVDEDDDDDNGSAAATAPSDEFLDVNDN